MGKPTGFIEYLRELPVDRTPQERVRDWKEFHHHMEERRLRNQAARCMDCGVPFCHTGKLISGMASRFVRVMPRDYHRMLQCIKRAHEQGLAGEDAIMVAFEENAKDLARVGGN